MAFYRFGFFDPETGKPVYERLGRRGSFYKIMLPVKRVGLRGIERRFLGETGKQHYLVRCTRSGDVNRQGKAQWIPTSIWITP